jgi:hypothetical protein
MARGAAVAPRGFTQGGRERVAGELLAGRYERGNALADDIERLLPDAEIIPGSRPTTAQLTQDRGASGLELGFLSKDSGNRALNQRYQQQEDARRALLEPIQEEAQLRRTQIGQDAEAAQAAARGGAGEVDRLASAPGRTMRGGEDVLGMEIRDAFDANYFGAQSQTNAAYDRARELNEGVIYNQEPLLASFRNIVGRGRHRQETAEMRKMIDTMAEATENGQSYSYEDMQNLRKELSGLRQVERAQGGNPELARKYGQMLEKVDDFLEGNTDALAGTAPRPQPGSPAYREATGFARDAVRSDPYYDDLQYLMQQGIRPESVISLIGQDGMRELNRVAPGLVRKSGTLELDNVASDLGGSGTYGYGSGWNEQSNGQALLDNLIDRLGPGRGRIRADTARLRDEYLSGQAQGHLGPTAEGRAATLQAKELRRIQGERFERGANERLSQKTGKSLEGKGIEVAKVPNLFFRPGPAGTDAANAFWRSSGKSEQARTAIEDYAISQLKSAAANADGSLNMDKWRSWMDGHAAALRKFPELRDKLNTARKAQQAIADAATAAEEAVGRATAGAKVAGIDNEMGLAQKVHSPLTEGGKKALRESGLFSEKDVDIITRARADYRRKLGVQSAGSVPGSRTALNQSTGSAIAEMAGNATALSRMPFVGRMVEATVGRVFKSQADAIEQLLLDATLDPSFAASLLRKATPGRLESVTRRLNDIARRYMNQGYTPGQVQMGVNVQQNSEE